MTLTIGEKIRRIRHTQKRSLRNLSTGTGLSATYLGDIERGKSSPTIPALSRIAGALGLPLAELVRDQENRDRGEHLLESQQLLTGRIGGYSLWKYGEERDGCRLAAYYIELPPNENRMADFLKNEGLACIYIKSGPVTLSWDEKEIRLNTGDSLQVLLQPPGFHCSAEKKRAGIFIFIIREEIEFNNIHEL
ncbi:MAG: XRE family transcriptional regulator [Candidatus Eisenbacteria bacterium]|uniref:XRE family transcriptional regulator n=1 Tax=Eiseniibacteriota bacterium TaxID=2212470 RepID=A0A948S294_UNCEI|nr:XRE family transcriptional regulator [Candidatus Eisenbacteria bacterium]MBU1950473.1 XRE family transcriptional regulator [Candidatus Eisenbacteria bacterium]MBU2692524.1 XRE family transcriptional regulator [Candidatus Eisenbacteria bacterium]